MEPIIIVKNIGKKYDIVHQKGGYITLRDVLAGIIKKPLSFIKNKTKEVIGREEKEEFWALKDLNFTIKKGEAVGVIGANGAGKSTLLKLLSKITPPTTGEITLKGSVASLLEVGTGFHPELTGRENIFLNGAVLGMSKKEIAKKFDSIVEFSGIETFLDTPVKRYSSGMYVRLAFAVAAHMEPDILIVDEVLAVGDAEFQKKCLGKMNEITKKAGRTVLFVSHNMSTIQKLCKKCILLEKGKIKMAGETQKVIDCYLNNAEIRAVTEYRLNPNESAQISKITILDQNEKYQARIPINQNFTIKINYEVFKEIKGAVISVFFYSGEDLLLLSAESDKNAKLKSYAPGEYTTSVSIPSFLFNVGTYYFDVRFHRPSLELIDHKQNISFEILDTENNPKSEIFKGQISGVMASILDYRTNKKTI